MITADFEFRDKDYTLADEEMVRFIRSEEGKSNSQETVYKYAKGLEDFSEWLHNREIDLYEVDFVDIQNYLSFLSETKDYADKTVYIKFISIRLFYRHLEKLEKIDENPVESVDVTDYIESPHKTKTEEQTGKKRIYLSKGDILTLVDNVPAPRLRNRLVILFMYYTGLRRSEVSHIKIEDLDRPNRTVEVEVKGGDKHTAVWHRKLDGLLKQWLDYGYRDSYPTAEESPYLFITNTTERLSGNRINEIIDEAAQNAGFQEVIFEDSKNRNRKKISSHNIRHSFAMNFIRDGGSFEALSNRLSHSSITTTEIYGEVEDDRGIKEYKEIMQPIETDEESEKDMCLLCGQKGNLETHHISYDPEKIISVCKGCQGKIHSKEEYRHLRPEKSREWAEDHGII